ncbi:MAG: TonB-dependent receptor [Paludibacter sp.]|nr:TonB-dependent receptor [Paludibacter sp.]
MRKTKLMLTMFLLLLFGINAIAQTKTILQGMVVDQNNQPVIGASIREKGSTNGTITDVDGRFTLQTSTSKPVVKISYIGYDNIEITVTNASQLKRIVLQESSVALNEVVAIGYGQVKKNDMTGSVGVLGENNLNKSTSTSPQQLIVGKMGGVNVTTAGGAPTDGATIRIRGGSSLTASNDPLIVVDGLPLDNRAIDGLGNILSSINPNEIETFTVLKDASATAIYGSRASNGVIMITTKKGSKGKIKIDYDAKLSIGTVAKTLNLLNGDEFRTIVKQETPDFVSYLGQTNTNWQDLIYHTAIGHDHNIGISGTIKNMPIRASLGYTDQNGILKTSEMQRYSGTLRINPSFLNNHLNAELGLKATYADNRFADQGACANAVRFDPTQPAMSSDSQYQKYGGYYTWMLNGVRNVNATRNPLAQLEQRSDKANVKRLIGDFKLDYKFHFLPDLKATLTTGIDYTNSDGKIRIDPSASWVELATAPDAQLKRDYTQDTRNEMINFVFNYKKEIKPIRSVFEAMTGTEEQHVWRKASGHDIRVNGTTLDDGSETEYFLVSYFGRFNYTYNNKYLLTASLRRDGSSRFSPDTRWGLFPSAALAWRISEEPFLKDSKTISNLKLRLSYGVTGQQDLTSNDYPYMGTYRLSDNYARYQIGNKFINTLRPEGYDQNIKWEQTTTYNAGLDFGFLKGRLNGSIDAYYRKTDDLLNTIPTPAGSNFTDRLLTNIGKMENKGIEFSLNGIAIDTKRLYWEVGVNVTYNQNKITKLTSYDDPNYPGIAVGGISGGGGSNTVQVNAVGHALNTFYLFKQKYDSNGKPIEGSYVDKNNDGQITDADKFYMKHAAPDVFMGYSSTLKYKNFDFSFSGRISLGNYVYDDINSNGARYQNLGTNSFLMNLPRDILNTNFHNAQYWSDYYLKNASFLKLDNLTLGYTCNNLLKISSSTNLNLRIYASVQNVFTITSYKGIDPEVSSGIDNAIYPRPRTYVLGISARF